MVFLLPSGLTSRPTTGIPFRLASATIQVYKPQVARVLLSTAISGATTTSASMGSLGWAPNSCSELKKVIHRQDLPERQRAAGNIDIGGFANHLVGGAKPVIDRNARRLDGDQLGIEAELLGFLHRVLSCVGDSHPPLAVDAQAVGEPENFCFAVAEVGLADGKQNRRRRTASSARPAASGATDSSTDTTLDLFVFAIFFTHAREVSCLRRGEKPVLPARLRGFL